MAEFLQTRSCGWAMIISASRRTDIPAFYAEWFMNRISDGYVLLKNPFNANQVRRVSLSPQDVDLIVFWTRNAEKLMPRLGEVDSRGFRYYFQYTINAYPRTIDKSVPNPWRAIETFIKLSDLIGSNKVIWRYDPIFVSNLSSVDEHKRVFEKIARALTGHTERVVISFVDIYKKVASNVGRIPGVLIEQGFENTEGAYGLISHLSAVAKDCGMSIQSCAEVIDLQGLGVNHGKCIDDELISDLFSLTVSGKKDKGQRLPCGCIESVDIGQYNTCLHGCQYCYATTNQTMAYRNYQSHNPLSPFLVGPPPHAKEEGGNGNTPKQDSLF